MRLGATILICQLHTNGQRLQEFSQARAHVAARILYTRGDRQFFNFCSSPLQPTFAGFFDEQFEDLFCALEERMLVMWLLLVEVGDAFEWQPKR